MLSQQWDTASLEWRNYVHAALSPILDSNHLFLDKPTTCTFKLTTGHCLNVAIINEQAEAWYGGEHSTSAFDFVDHYNAALTKHCRSFLDIGGHQLVWSTFYALAHPHSHVVSFEPSPLNCLLGLFNCFINGVLDRVVVHPRAVATPDDCARSDGTAPMLIDYVTIPPLLSAVSIAGQPFDFIKCDIEGYEFDLLSDAHFLRLCSHAKHVHFELHLGHLIRRNVTTHDIAGKVKRLGFTLFHWPSGLPFEVFLQSHPSNGYYPFVLKTTN